MDTKERNRNTWIISISFYRTPSKSDLKTVKKLRIYKKLVSTSFLPIRPLYISISSGEASSSLRIANWGKKNPPSRSNS